MKRLLNTTTALSLALFNVQPWPLMAQTLTEDGSVIAADGTVLCAAVDGVVCIPEEYTEQAAAIDAAMAEALAAAEAAIAAQAAADAAAAAQAEADAAAAVAAQAEADAAVAAAAEADAAAAAAAEADAAAAAAAAAEADAAASAAAQAEAEAAAVAAGQAEAEAAAAAEAEAKAAADAAIAAAAEADAAAAADAAAQADADAAAAAAVETDAAAAAVAAEAEAAAAALAAEADAAAAAQADADAASAADADAAAGQAEADAAVAAEEEAAAAAAALAEAEAASAAATAAADAAAAAGADAAAIEAANAAALAAAAAAAAAQAELDAAVQADADAAAQAQAQAEADAAAKAEADAAAAAAVVPEVAPDAAPDAAADAPVALTAEEQAAADAAAALQAEADAAALAAAEAELKVQEDGTLADPAAGLKTADVVVDETLAPVDVLVPTQTEVETLSTLLAEPEAGVDLTTVGAAAALSTAVVAEGAAPEVIPLADQPVSDDAVSTVTELLTETSARTSTQEFTAAPVAVEGGKKNRLSDLEKVGLVVLGALVVGAIINEGNKQEERRVVSNTGDRIVVLKPDGTYQVYKDDDTIIRRPGSNVRTETYRDGSTRTIVERRDGTQVVTIRDATGRVLRRAHYDTLGRELVLIDDLVAEEVVYVRDLPAPRTKKVVISTQDEDYDLKAALAARDIAALGRTFSLRQIREIAQVRALAATIDVDTITFDSGSAAIKATEAQDLADLGRLLQDLIDKNPAEMFLIEGHTDATGKAALNLALSDRRAESVALALTEYFDIPPENMVIQGYGETELRIDTPLNEARNRRVAVRIITPLMRVNLAEN